MEFHNLYLLKVINIPTKQIQKMKPNLFIDAITEIAKLKLLLINKIF